MPITLDANGKYIHVTGGTSGAPVTWEDIVAADSSGGWGRITTLNAAAPKQYSVATDTIIYIGNGGATSTYVAVERCQITFTNGYFQIWSGADVTKATLRVGRTNDEYHAVALTMRGLTTDDRIRMDSPGRWYIYNSAVVFLSPLSASIVPVVDQVLLTGIGNKSLIFNNGITATNSILGRVQVDSAAGGLAFNNVVLSILVINHVLPTPLRDADIQSQLLMFNTAAGQVVELYDSSHGPAVYVLSSGPTPPEIHQYSTLGMTVMDAAAAISGAAVVVKNTLGTTVYSGTTDAAGQIPNQDVLFRTRVVTAFNTFTDVDYTPHTVTITKAGYLERVLTLDMSTRHDEIEVLEPLPDFPATGDVRLATAYDDGSKVGTLALPATGDVRLATAYDDGSKLGTLALPTVSDVRLATAYDDGSKVGTLALPAVSDVRAAIAYDDGSKVGTLALPPVSDVRLATAYDDGSKLGTLALPAATNVLSGVGYGAAGAEFTGTLEQSIVVGEGITVTITEDVLTATIND